tara:strand:- start:310 stop:456 length:147 start_codon:yes stop_codon:yes gene_type:complete
MCAPLCPCFSRRTRGVAGAITQDEHGFTPLHVAIEKGNIEAARYVYKL